MSPSVLSRTLRRNVEEPERSTKVTLLLGRRGRFLSHRLCHRFASSGLFGGGVTGWFFGHGKFFAYCTIYSHDTYCDLLKIQYG